MESKRNYQLDVLKFFFTLCIFLYHARLLAPAGGLARQISDKWGWFGVHFFFIVSGMLMANSFMRHRTEQTQEPGKAAVRFVVHKFRSIAGIYFISFSFNFVIRFCIELHAHQDVSALTTLWKLILGSVPELFLVQMSGVRQIGVNSVTWYISAMLLVMLPLYYFLCKKPDFFLHVFSPTAALMLYGFFTQMDNGYFDQNDCIGPFSGGVLRALCGICAGTATWALAQWIREHLADRKYSTKLTLIEVLFSVYLLLVWIFPSFSAQLMYGALLPIPLLVAVVFSGKSRISALFQMPWLRHINRLSMLIYFNHYAARQLITRFDLWLDRPYLQRYLLMAMLTAGFCLLCATLEWLIHRCFSQKASKPV